MRGVFQCLKREKKCKRKFSNEFVFWALCLILFLLLSLYGVISPKTSDWTGQKRGSIIYILKHSNQFSGLNEYSKFRELKKSKK